MHETGEERPGSEYRGPRRYELAGLCIGSEDSVAPDFQTPGRGLDDIDSGTRLNRLNDPAPIEIAVGLRPRRTDRGAFGRIQGSKLDAGVVDLFHELPLPKTSDSRIARHLTKPFAIEAHQCCPAPHPGSRQGRLRPGVTTADDQNIVIFELSFQAALPAGG